MVRTLDGLSETIVSHHAEGKIPGAVRVIIGGSADQREAVDTLLRIASWIEDEAKKAAEGCELLEEN